MSYAALPLALLLATAARAVPEWRGDFETCDLSQWGQAQRVSADRLRAVTAPTWEGRCALAATVSQGDDPIGASGNRAELVRGTLEEDGAERWYRWAVLFPEDFPDASRWQLFTQWHHDGCCGSPPVEFHVTGGRLALNVQSTPRWSEPLQKGRWYEFLFHVRWSADPAKGFAELWVDGRPVLVRTALATAFPGMRNYLKVGYYRDASIPGTATVYVDGMVSGRTREEVLPAAQSPSPDAATGTGTTPPPGLPRLLRPPQARARPKAPRPRPRPPRAAPPGAPPRPWACWC
jgi:hypothetical protein